MNTLPENCCGSLPHKPLKALPGLYQSLQHWLKIQRLHASIVQERRQLLQLPEAMLKDIGISRAQSQTEARRIDIPECRLKSLK